MGRPQVRHNPPTSDIQASSDLAWSHQGDTIHLVRSPATTGSESFCRSESITTRIRGQLGVACRDSRPIAPASAPGRSSNTGWSAMRQPRVGPCQPLTQTAERRKLDAEMRFNSLWAQCSKIVKNLASFTVLHPHLFMSLGAADQTRL